MISVKIGDEARSGSDVSERWVNHLVNGMRAQGHVPCVRITFDTPDAKLTLSTPTCGGGAGGGRRPLNTRETELVELWRKLHLDTENFSGGQIVAFLKQVR